MGVGEKENLAKVNPNVLSFLRSNKINIEVLTTVSKLESHSESFYLYSLVFNIWSRIKKMKYEETKIDDENEKI